MCIMDVIFDGRPSNRMNFSNSYYNSRCIDYFAYSITSKQDTRLSIYKIYLNLIQKSLDKFMVDNCMYKWC